METPFELLLISPEQDVKKEQSILCELFNLGLALYHLRKPAWSINDLRSFLITVPKEFVNRIVLHSHFELTGEFGVKGIHLNESNKKLLAHLPGQKIISASFHSLEDIKANSFSYEYVFLSPIFDSISKAGYKAKFDLESLKGELDIIKKQKQLPKIIALGGINTQNIMMVKQAGFPGAALFGAVWQNENPVQAFLEVQSKIKVG